MNMKYKFKIVFALVVLICLCIVVTGCERQTVGEPISKTEFMMNTVMTIKIYDSKDEKILEEVFDRLREIENRMSKTISDSDVSKINQNAGKNPVKVHKDVYYVLKKSIEFAELTDGAYDPTIGPLVELWNIKEEGENEVHSIPEKEKIVEAMNKVDYRKLELLDDNNVLLKEEGMIIDLGGIVKGYAADEVKKILKQKGVNSAIIDLGGNVYAYGEKPKDKYWKIGIQNPFEFRGNYIGIMSVVDSSIVTSGDYERYFEVNGKRYHHIIDPKTGYPAESGLSAVSVVTKNSIDGDALSTSLFILGREKGTELIKKLENVDAIFIAKDGKTYISPDLKDKFELKNKKFNIINNEY